MPEHVLNGVDLLSTYLAPYADQRLALYTHAAAVNRNYEATEELLSSDYDLCYLIVGEGGLRGEHYPREVFGDAVDMLTGVPVISMYQYGDIHLTEDVLDGFDVLVVDIRDLGTRANSTVTILHRLLDDCGRAGKKVLVLDRPNPLGGEQRETLPFMEEMASPWGCCDLPLRHGLTVGELARYLNSLLEVPAEIEVGRVRGWQREMMYPDMGRTWIPAPQQVGHYTTALLYPGMRLFEGTNLSFGEGTSLPYEIFGAPFLDALQLSSILNSKTLSGVFFRPIYFRPVAGRYAGKNCQGVQVQVLERRSVRPVEMTVSIMDQLRVGAPGDFRYLDAGETGTLRPMIDLLAGNDWLRQENLNVRELILAGREAVDHFEERVAPYLLYGEEEETPDTDAADDANTL